MANVEYEIIKEVGVIAEKQSGWKKELNLISWNKGAAKYDIREWSPDHAKMGKGITIDRTEAERLIELLRAEL